MQSPTGRAVRQILCPPADIIAKLSKQFLPDLCCTRFQPSRFLVFNQWSIRDVTVFMGAETAVILKHRAFHSVTHTPSLSFFTPSIPLMILPTVLLLTLLNLVLSAILSSSVNRMQPGLQLCTISSKYTLAFWFLVHFAFFMLLSCCHHSISCCSTSSVPHSNSSSFCNPPSSC